MCIFSKPFQDRKLRVCKLTKDQGGFGFFLRDDNGHFLTKVEAGSPAANAGARENDEVVAINGKDARSKTHEEVCAKLMFKFVFARYQQNLN